MKIINKHLGAIKGIELAKMVELGYPWVCYYREEEETENNEATYFFTDEKEARKFAKENNMIVVNFS